MDVLLKKSDEFLFLFISIFNISIKEDLLRLIMINYDMILFKVSIRQATTISKIKRRAFVHIFLYNGYTIYFLLF